MGPHGFYQYEFRHQEILHKSLESLTSRNNLDSSTLRIVCKLDRLVCVYVCVLARLRDLS